MSDARLVRRREQGRSTDTSVMGAKDWFICYADTDVASVLSAHPQFDREATKELVRRLFPDQDVVATDDGTLGENANPADEDVFAAVWRAPPSCVLSRPRRTGHPSWTRAS